MVFYVVNNVNKEDNDVGLYYLVSQDGEIINKVNSFDKDFAMQELIKMSYDKLLNLDNTIEVYYNRYWKNGFDHVVSEYTSKLLEDINNNK